MNISKKVVSQLQKAEKEKTSRTKVYTIGAISKGVRAQKSLTLADVAKDICSVSYLSKIETNKISPNEQTLDLLMEKLSIPRYEVFLMENTELLMNQLIEGLYSYDIASITEMYENVKEFNDNQAADIIKMCYFLMKEDYFEVKYLMEENNPILSSMNYDMLKVYSLLSAECLTIMNDYTQANDIISAILKGSYSKHYDILAKDLLYRLYAKEDRTVLAGEYYNYLLMYYAENIQMARLEKVKKVYMNLLYNSKEYSKLIDDFEKDKLPLNIFNDADEVNFLLGSSNFELGREIAGAEYINKIRMESPYYARACSYLYAISKDHDEFINSLEEREKNHPNFYSLYFLTKIKNASLKDVFESREYHGALKDADIAEKIRLYNMEYDYLTSASKYKSAVLIKDKIQELKETSKSIRF